MEEILLENMNPVPQPNKPERKYNKSQQAFLESRDILVILIVFMLLYILFFRVVIVVGDSMFDTLAQGDYLLLTSSILYRSPEAGDIVVISKDSFRGGECFVKRVIATEGQSVDIDFATGDVFVNGVLLEEDYIHTPTMLDEGVNFPLTVEKGCVFVMGDNRMNSRDSRSPEIGQVDCREILGKAIFLLFPGTGSDDNPMEFNFRRIGVIRHG